RSALRAASAALRRRRQGLRAARRPVDRRVFELFGETRRDVGAGPSPGVADRGLSAPRTSGAAALLGRGGPLDRTHSRGDGHGGGWVRGGVFCAAVEEHGVGVCETWQCRTQNAE